VLQVGVNLLDDRVAAVDPVGGNGVEEARVSGGEEGVSLSSSLCKPVC
jgi:hypothetical protein